MLSSDELYNSSYIIRKWIYLFKKKIDIKEMFMRGFQFSDIMINTYNLIKKEEEKVRRNMYYDMKLIDN